MLPVQPISVFNVPQRNVVAEAPLTVPSACALRNQFEWNAGRRFPAAVAVAVTRLFVFTLTVVQTPQVALKHLQLQKQIVRKS